MRRVAVTFALVVTAALATAGGAFAASPYSGCSVGPVGAGGSTIGSWELFDESALATALETAGYDPAFTAGEFESNDKNGDGLLCVMTQVLPNDASGNTTFFVSHDNNARPK